MPGEYERSREKKGLPQRESPVVPAAQVEEGCPLNSFSSGLDKVEKMEKGSPAEGHFLYIACQVT